MCEVVKYSVNIEKFTSKHSEYTKLQIHNNDLL